MTEAIVGGLLKSNMSDKSMITSSSPSPPRREFMAEKFDIKTFKDNLEVLKRNDVIVLSFKPFAFEQVLNEIKEHVTEDHLIVSVVAGKTIAQMQSILGKNRRVVRSMVNTPALIGEMAGAYSMGEYATEEDTEVVGQILNSVGIAY